MTSFDDRNYYLDLYLRTTSHKKETPVPRNSSALRREAAALLAEAERLENRPRDTFLDGTVLTFTKPGRYGVRDAGGWPITDFVGDLKYAALKAGNRPECWFLTGQVRQAKTWEDLLDFIGEENLSTVLVKNFRNGAPLLPTAKARR